MTTNYYSGPKLSFIEIMALYKKKKKITQQDGYIYVYLPEHPNSQKGGYIRFHRVVMEEKLGRFLNREERVHHINRNKLDNRPQNLEYFPNESLHQSSIPHKYKTFVYKNRIKKYNREWYMKNRDRILKKQKLYRQRIEELERRIK